MAVFRKRSDLSGHMNEMEIPVTLAEVEAWKAGGELIQHVFPHLSAGEREFLVSGVTPAEWDAMIGGEE